MKTIIYNNDNEKYTLWLITKIAILSSVFLLLSNLINLAVLYALLPLKEIRPYLIAVHPKSEQIVTIEPVNKGRLGFDILMEAMVRQYVLLRESIDFQTETVRWQKVYWFSEKSIYENFENLMKKENPDSPFKKFYDRGITRLVKIVSSQCFGSVAPNIWQVEWQARDTNLKSGKLISRTNYISTLTVSVMKQKVELNDRFINPLGFTVIEYSVSFKSKESK